MPGPQDSIFQHLLEPEAGPEGGIFWCLFRWLVCWTNFPKFMVEASKLRMLGPQDSIRVAGQILPLRDNKIRASFLGPVGPLWALPQIWPHHFIALCSAYFISKNQFSRPRSFRGDRATNNSLPCVLLYLGYWYWWTPVLLGPTRSPYYFKCLTIWVYIITVFPSLRRGLNR